MDKGKQLIVPNSNTIAKLTVFKTKNLLSKSHFELVCCSIRALRMALLMTKLPMKAQRFL